LLVLNEKQTWVIFPRRSDIIGRITYPSAWIESKLRLHRVLSSKRRAFRSTFFTASYLENSLILPQHRLQHKGAVMPRSIFWAAAGLLISISVIEEAWAQQSGNPTAVPPGGANAPGSAGAAGTPQAAGPAGTTRAAGGTTPTGRTQAATPATRLGAAGVAQPPRARTDSGVIFGGQGTANTSGIGGNRFGGGTTQMMFERNQGLFDRAATGGGNPATSIPGRANMSGGSTSRTLRPGSGITGDPNDTSMGPGSVPLAPRAVFRNDLLLGVGSALNAPLAPIAPIVPLAPQAQNARTAAIAPVAPTARVVPVIVMPTEAQASGRSGVAVSVPATPREGVIPQEGTATATAYPTRNPTATGDATVTASPPAGTVTVESEMGQTPNGAAPPTTTYRGTPGATAQRSGLTFSYPGYTQWQGYYWFHSRAAGWHYWDGLRWVQFARAQN
jgi:hypothetical protein